MIYLFRQLISVMLHTVSIIFNAGICFHRLGGSFFTWRGSRFGKELKCTTNNNNDNHHHHHHHHPRLQVGNNQELFLVLHEGHMSRNTCSGVALKTNKKKGGISALDQSEQSECEQSDFFMPWLIISS